MCSDGDKVLGGGDGSHLQEVEGPEAGSEPRTKVIKQERNPSKRLPDSCWSLGTVQRVQELSHTATQLVGKRGRKLKRTTWGKERAEKPDESGWITEKVMVGLGPQNLVRTQFDPVSFVPADPELDSPGGIDLPITINASKNELIGR